MDGGLRKILPSHLSKFHWQAIETGGTGRGIPDMNFCFGGIEGWVENKLTTADAVNLSPEQVGWIERRCRAGGRVFIGVRRLCKAGPRRVAKDEFHLYPGVAARELKVLGLSRIASAKRLGLWAGGPAKWDWNAIAAALTRR